MLKQIVLPGTDLSISRICLGTQYFGTKVPTETAFSLMDQFLDAGGNIIDTALIYSDWLSMGKGISEKTIGRWLRERNNRNRVVISTKGAHPRFDDPSPRLDAGSIRHDLEQSLRNLQVDTVDLYWLHRDDESRPVEEILHTLEQFRAEGKIRYYGCSNWRPYRIEAAMEAACCMKIGGFCANQAMWNLAYVEKMVDPTTVRINPEMYETHLRHRLPFFSFSSQAGGYFSMREKGSACEEGRFDIYRNDRTEKLWAMCGELTRKYNCCASDIVLSYLLSQQAFPVIPLVGSDSAELLEMSLSAANIVLDISDVERINQLNL